MRNSKIAVCLVLMEHLFAVDAMNWTDVLTLGGTDNSYNGELIDVGRDSFNDIFRNSSDYPIIRRTCQSSGSYACVASHQNIYYKRLRNKNSFDAYSNMKETWSSTDNVLGTDFDLYSSLQDALSNTNAWTACNYDDEGVAAFRDCGPSELIGGLWTSDVTVWGSRHRNPRNVIFSIYTPRYIERSYFRGPNTGTWAAGETYCENEGGTLATIETYDEWTDANTACGGYHCWIGAHDTDVEGVWEWADGTDISSSYGFNSDGTATTGQTPWYPGEPNNAGDEDCAHIIYGLTLYNDQACTYQGAYPLCSVVGNTGTSEPTTSSPTTASPSKNPTTDPTKEPTGSPTVDECTEDMDNCDPLATCTDLSQGFECTCPAGYDDVNSDGTLCIGCDGSEFHTFNWETLTEEGTDIPEIDVTEFSMDTSDLSLNIRVELDYLSKVHADGEIDANWGATYVLDFEDFDAHKDDIDKPGTCQNRNESAFIGKSFVTDYWEFSDQPQEGNVGSSSFLAYPPPNPKVGQWDVYMKPDIDSFCSTIVYEGKFTWEDLRGCTSNGGSSVSTSSPPYQDSYTQIVADDDWLNLTGTFYINVVSPFWYTGDFGYYRVYQLLSQPFVIALCRAIKLLGSTGINLFQLNVVAVYKEDDANDFKLVLFTETADYLKLTRTSNDQFIFDGTDAGNSQISSGDFDVPDTPDNTGSNECVDSTSYICTQLWELNIADIDCIPDQIGTDFSGNYLLTFTPECRDTGDAQLAQYCEDWLSDHPEINTTIALDTDLVWKDEICDPIIFEECFGTTMEFYADDTFSSPVGENELLFYPGESDIFVEIISSFPSGTLDVFDLALISVHICTFDPLIIPSSDTNDMSTFGCYSSDRDSEFDVFFYNIYDDATSSSNNGFSLLLDTETDIRFSFTVPEQIARDKIYIQAELEVVLGEITEIGPLGTSRRRRVLLEMSSSPTANQISNFVGQIGIAHHHGTEPKQHPKKEPFPVNKPYPINKPFPPSSTSPSTWTLTLAGFIIIILSMIISFMCYSKYCDGSTRPLVFFGKKKGYKVVNVEDSESDYKSEANPLNVVSEEN